MYVFVTSFSVDFVLKGQTRCPNDYDSPRGSLHKTNLLLSRSYWPTLNSGSSLPAAMFLFRVAALCDSQS